MKKTILLIISITTISKILGLARDMVLSYMYGTSSITDAYIISLTIPTVIFTMIGLGIKTTYIPIYSRILHEKDSNTANKYTSELIIFLMIICTLIVIPVMLFTEPIVKIFASGFDNDTMKLASRFTKITIMTLYISVVNYILVGYLQIKKRFLITTIVGIFINVIVILSVYLSKKFSVDFLAIGQVAAIVIEAMFLFTYSIKSGFRISKAETQKKYILKTIIQAIPVIIGSSVNQINKLVDRTIASYIAVGGVSTLVYANRLNLFIHGIIVIPISTVLYPAITKMGIQKKFKNLKESLNNAIIAIFILLIPAIFGGIVLSDIIIELIYGRGAFTLQDIDRTSSVFRWYLFGILGIGLRELLSNVFYSLNDTRTPMINSVFGMVLNILLNIVLSHFFGLKGLAMATSISAIIIAILMYVTLTKKIGNLNTKDILISLFKVIVISSLMVILVTLVKNHILFELKPWISFTLLVVIGVTAYLILLYIIKVPTVDSLIDSIRKHIMKKKST